jgi:hypothetical protein
MQGKGITWLASYPRSGNTWLRFFLHGLLELMSGTPDGEIRISDIGRYSQWESNPVNFLPFSKEPTEESFEAISKLRPTVQKAMLNREATSIFVKTHLVLARLYGTPTINPEVTRGAVYLVRDPRDVAVSYAAHLEVPMDSLIEIMANQNFVPANGVAEFLGSWSRNVQSWTVPQQPTILVMRYEDMVARPLISFSRIVQHVGIRAPQALIERAVRLSSFDRLQQQEAMAGFDGWKSGKGAFFRQGRSGAWRDQLTPAQARKIEMDHGEQMLRFGYLSGRGAPAS